MKKALITGSFDPPTKGHLDLIKKCAKLFEETVVLVSVNSGKTYMFPLEKRLEMLRAMCAGISGITVDHFDGLVGEYAGKNGIDVIVKGARNGSDFEYETMLDRVNKTVCSINTIIIPSAPEYEHISSTSAREMIIHGGNKDAFLPEEVIRLI